MKGFRCVGYGSKFWRWQGAVARTSCSVRLPRRQSLWRPRRWRHSQCTPQKRRWLSTSRQHQRCLALHRARRRMRHARSSGVFIYSSARRRLRHARSRSVRGSRGCLGQLRASTSRVCHTCTCRGLHRASTNSAPAPAVAFISPAPAVYANASPAPVTPTPTVFAAPAALHLRLSWTTSRQRQQCMSPQLPL